MRIHHRFPAFGVLVAVLLQVLPATAQDNVVSLDGHNLLFDDVVRVAAGDYQVTIAPSALDLMQKSYELVLAAEEQGIPIYGLNRGVGLNKDRPIKDNREASIQFNLNNLHATSAGVGPDAPEMLVRAAMVIRLNTMLLGRTGARPRVAELYRDFLNKKIHPVLPSRASLGEADITILAHVGLAMIGEGEVIYAKAGGLRTKMTAKEALADAKIEPLVPFAKDSLAIMSSNAYTAAVAILAARDVQRLLRVAPGVFALSLEGLKGNTAPFLKPAQDVRGYASTQKSAAKILDQLASSYLFECTSKTGAQVACDDNERPLQDPLSYRTGSHLLAAADDALAALVQALAIQINSSDDNPAVILGVRPDADAPMKVRAYYVECDPRSDLRQCQEKPYGAVIPTANFEPLPWVMPLQATSLALGHLSRAAVARITRLSTPEFTGLSRFLTPAQDKTLGFSAIHQTFAALDAEIQGLIPPVSTQTLWTVVDIDDTATSSLDAANRLQRIADNAFPIFGIELLHAAQAIDLRRRDNPSLKIGAGSGAYYQGLRTRVPFLDRDRALTPDIAAATNWLRSSVGPQAAR